MTVELEKGQRDLLITLGSVGVGLATIWLLQPRPALKLALSRLIDVKATRDIANSLPSDEKEFIWAAWHLVGCDIKYKSYGSDFQFFGSTIKGYRIDLPTEVIALGASNCVGKSALLTSILRNRLPASRVYMVIGNLKMDGVGGHAWVLAEIDGKWYRIEATHCPINWTEATNMSGIYESKAMFNDEELICYDAELCVNVSPASCCDAICECEGASHVSYR